MTDPSFGQEIEHQRQLDALRRTNGDLLRRLDEEKRRTQRMVTAVYEATRDAVQQVVIPPIVIPPHDERSDTPETAILLASDWQLGKKTPTYSTEICAQRVEQLAERVIRLTEIQRARRPIRKLIIAALGDMIEGEMIFPGQEHRIDASLFRQTHLDGPEIFASLIMRMLGAFEEVEVLDVIGNHGALGGRGRKNYHPESNGDMMLYHTTWRMLRKERGLKWTPNFVPGERAWKQIFTIGLHSYFLFHGDQMRGGGFAGIPMYGFIRAINNWAAGVIEEPFHYALCGHWHQLWSMPINSRILWINGSTESNNEWLREELKAQAPPGQWLLFAHDRRGITSEHRVWLS